MARTVIPTAFIVLVVVRLGHRFLLVREKSHGQPWFLPAGRVEVGETLVEAAKRETREESGIDVNIEGLLRIEHTPRSDGSRLRAIFVASPIDDKPPKVLPDAESLGAGWFTLEQVKHLPLRGIEVIDLFTCVSKGALLVPPSFITLEGTPYTGT